MSRVIRTITKKIKGEDRLFYQLFHLHAGGEVLVAESESLGNLHNKKTKNSVPAGRFKVKAKDHKRQRGAEDRLIDVSK